MSKKSIIFLTGVCICILGVSVPAMAETTSRRANIKSSGNLDFDNGTVYFTSSDLTYLADEIDNLEDTYKQTSVDALNDVGTFFLSDGTIVNDREQNEVDTDEKKSALSFGSILEGIKKSQSIDSLSQTQVLDKDGNPLFYETEEAQTNKNIHSLTTTDTGFPAFYQPANANNLSAGTAAWVDGTLIKGNGSDNAAYVKQGLTESVPNIIASLYNNESVSYTLYSGTYGNNCTWTSEPIPLYVNPDGELAVLNTISVAIAGGTGIHCGYASAFAQTTYSINLEDDTVIKSGTVSKSPGFNPGAYPDVISFSMLDVKGIGENESFYISATGKSWSSLNPNMCNNCFAHAAAYVKTVTCTYIPIDLN